MGHQVFDLVNIALYLQKYTFSIAPNFQLIQLVVRILVVYRILAVNHILVVDQKMGRLMNTHLKPLSIQMGRHHPKRGSFLLSPVSPNTLQHLPAHTQVSRMYTYRRISSRLLPLVVPNMLDVQKHLYHVIERRIALSTYL